MKKEPFIILNRIKTPDGKVLTSYHRHNFVYHQSEDGESYFIDGGTDYVRGGNLHLCENLSVYSDAPFEQVRKSYHRGFAHKKGKVMVPLFKMTNEWVTNLKPYFEGVLVELKKANYNDDAERVEYFIDMIEKEIEYRKENNINIEKINVRNLDVL